MRSSSGSTRAVVALAGLGLLAGLAWFLLSTGSTPGGDGEGTIVRDADRDELDPTPGVDLAATEARVDGSSSREALDVETVLAPDPADGSRWTLSGRLVSRRGEEPLPGHLIFALLAGTDPTEGPVPRGQRVVTGPGGEFAVRGLTRPGPWDVYSFPFDPSRARQRAVRDARVGTGTAEQAPAGEPRIYRTRVGPLVVLRSPLPPGVRHEGLTVEVREPMSLLSSSMQLAGGFARMHRGPDGHLRARVPHVGPSEKNKGYAVRIVSEDGLWSLVQVDSGTLNDETVIEIDDALEPRAKIALRLSIVGDPDAATGAAMPCVGWELPLGDPARDPLQLPTPLTSDESFHRLVPTGPDTWELHDLPVGPVTIRQRRHVPRLEGRPEYEVIGTVQVPAVHGDPAPVEVKVGVKS